MINSNVLKKSRFASVKRSGRMRTSHLIGEKIHRTEWSAIFGALKLGFGGAVAIVATNLVPLLGGAAFDHYDATSIAIGLYGIAGFVYCTYLEARYIAEKEVINDLLAIRLSRTGTSKS